MINRDSGELSHDHDQAFGVNVEALVGVSAELRNAARLLRLWNTGKAFARTMNAPDAWLSLNDIMRGPLTSLMEAMGADEASLLLADETSSGLVTRVSVGLGQKREDQVSIPFGLGISGHVLSSRRPYVLSDMSQSDVVDGTLRFSGMRSYVGVPLSTEQSLLGVVHVASKAISRYTELDGAILGVIVEPLTTALALADLESSLPQLPFASEAAFERLRSLQSISRILIAVTEPKEICSTIIHHAVPASIKEGQRAVWMLEDGKLKLIAGNRQASEFSEISLDAHLPAAECLAAGIPFFVESYEEMVTRWPPLANHATKSFAGFPLIDHGRRLGLMAIGFQEERIFELDERQFLVALADLASSALARAMNRKDLERQRNIAERRKDRLQYLANASEKLSESLDLQTTMQAVADLAVPRLTDRCALHLLQDGVVTRYVLAPELNEDERELIGQNQGGTDLNAATGVGKVLRTGELEYMELIPQELIERTAGSAERLELLNRVGLGGYLALPLKARGRILGSLSFVNRAGRPLTLTDKELAEELTARAAMALDNASLYSEKEHAARHLSRAFLPGKLPDTDSVEVAIQYHPFGSALSVGGDFYEIIRQDDGSIFFLIGDVQGKGVEAAHLTGLARNTVKACLNYVSEPAEAISCLNKAICENVELISQKEEERWERAKLCTAALVKLTLVSGGAEISACSAGHPMPLIKIPGSGVTEACEPGLLLGVDPEFTYRSFTSFLPGGSSLVLFTDGAIERFQEGQMFGPEGICEILEQKDYSTTDELGRSIVEAALTYDQGKRDDMVIITARI